MVGLVPLSVSDGPRILRWRNDPGISRFMYTDHVISEAEHAAWLEAAIHDDAQRHWVIHLDGEPVGLASITHIDRVHSSAEWAFYLASPEVRGRGVGSVVEYRVLECVFRELALERLSCAVLAFNEAVVAMHESFGFTREGTLRSAIRKSDGRVDVVLMGQLRDEWMARRDAHRVALLDRGLIEA